MSIGTIRACLLENNIRYQSSNVKKSPLPEIHMKKRLPWVLENIYHNWNEATFADNLSHREQSSYIESTPVPLINIFKKL